MHKIDNLREKINTLVPDAIFSEVDDDYESIIWDDPRAQPSAADVEAANGTPVHDVSKFTIITRLVEANKFAEALAALKADDLLYEKWSTVQVVHSNDQAARDLFTAIGLDPDVILAFEER